MSSIKERNIAVCIILNFITCGIYGIIWFVNVTDDMRAVSKDESLSGGMALLLTIITCGIYGYVWAWKMGKAALVARKKHHLPASDNSILYLLLQIFGLGIINYCLMQHELNEIATASAKKRN